LKKSTELYCWNSPKQSIKPISLLATTLIATLLFAFTTQNTKAEIKFGMNGQLHNSLQIKDNPEKNVYADRTWFGFNAYTPKGFAHLNLQLDKLNTTSIYQNAPPSIIREAYTGTNLSTHWRFMIGLKNVPFGMLKQEQTNVLGIDGVNYLMGIQQATGLQFQFNQERWNFDFGIYNPAYRSIFISTETKITESLGEAPLLATRLSYQVGQLLTIQGSFAVQDYENSSTFTQTYHATKYFDFGIDIDISPLWGIFYNYTQVEHAFASLSAQTRTASQLQIDWTPNRFWQVYLRGYEAFDKNVKSQLLIYLGTAYQIDKHNRIVISGNLGSNNKDYTGFLGEQKQSFLLQHQFNF
jgi:hypothetical protein